MDAISYHTARSESDLKGILALQQANHLHQITEEDFKTEGFLMVRHQIEDLEKMNRLAPQIICKDQDEVVAFVLAMTEASKDDITILIPMFQLFNNLNYKGKLISQYRYMVVGQVCVAKGYRGIGIFNECYELFKNTFKDTYDFAITEISTRNPRSLKAHQKIGFQTVHTYTAPDGEEWDIVVWEW